MTERAQKLLEEVLSLPAEEQADFIDELTARYGGEHAGFASAAVAQEWDSEIARRLDDIDSGRVKPIPVEDVLAELQRLEDE